MNSKLYLALSLDSTTIELHGMPEDVLNYFKTKKIDEKVWESFFAVYPETKNKELKDFQLAIKGKYRVRDSLIVFLPHINFVIDSSYFARCYSQNLLSKPSDILLGKKISGKKPIAELEFTR
ncbi:MAG: hypothetical protein H7096_02110 [Flavobacterium sp.]|nr:hypothetical protein [Pedobacter sp.]